MLVVRHPSVNGSPIQGICVLMGLATIIAAMGIAAYLMGGATALVAMVVGISVGSVLLRFAGLGRPQGYIPRDSVTGLMLRPGLDVVMSDVAAATVDGTLKSACFVLAIDDTDEFVSRHGQSGLQELLVTTSDRVLAALRDGDTIARIGENRLAVCLSAVRQLDLELCLQLAGRLQSAIEEPVQLGGTTLFVSCSIGFCLRNRVPQGGGAQAWLSAASTALEEARRNGPSTIRVFVPAMLNRQAIRETLHTDVSRALDAGEFEPWFQPQLCTDTGRIAGFEALARWVHPIRGPIPPDQFLPVLEEHGLLERLSDVMLRQSLQALKDWDVAGFDIPQVSINLSQQDLNNPNLCDRIAWELDRQDMGGGRLGIEILETVVSKAPDDVVVRNVDSLSALGCMIDLDDYGTGHASIATLRRLPVHRIKIDRSFVIKSDRDPEQQRLIGALLSMADRLELQTLAEGVETAGEHAFLAQLGCQFVQGFAIARPMPFAQTRDWLRDHVSNQPVPPRIGRQTR